MITDSRLRAVFDWRQLRRWNVSERELPAGSEIRFREIGLWEQYRWQIILVATVISLQTALILGLLYEHRRRRAAEKAARNSLAELAHVNRLATAGELSASIAHEVNQPLTGIVANANAGLLWLSAAKPNLDEARASFMDIVETGHHAAEVVENIRSFVTKSVPQSAMLDMNELVRTVLALAHADLRAQGVTVATQLGESLPPVHGDRVQLKQVVMNLVMNAADAMATLADRERTLRITSEPHEGGLLVRIEDSGPGIAPAEMERVFKPFHTTKAKGMGMGLSISRSIVAAHHGRLWALPGVRFGAVFCLTLPPAASAAQSMQAIRPAIGVPESAPEPAA